MTRPSDAAIARAFHAYTAGRPDYVENHSAEGLRDAILAMAEAIDAEAKDAEAGDSGWLPIEPDEVLVAIKRGEAYEDVHPEIVADDAMLGCKFEWRHVPPPQKGGE
jgi:hypothetical protein